MVFEKILREFVGSGVGFGRWERGTRLFWKKAWQKTFNGVDLMGLCVDVEKSHGR